MIELTQDQINAVNGGCYFFGECQLPARVQDRQIPTTGTVQSPKVDSRWHIGRVSPGPMAELWAPDESTGRPFSVVAQRHLIK